MPKATTHDGAVIEFEIRGNGPAVLLPVNPTPVEGPKADEMRRWGADPALGRSLVEGLADAYRVVAFDYEGHVLAVPKPETLTPDAISRDLLAVADAAGIDRFAYYGYSWLAASGLQLALRTDRLSALIMGGFPPIDGPYADMLTITNATHALAVAAAERPPADSAAGSAAGSAARSAAGSAAGSPDESGADRQDEASSGEPDWSSAEVSLSPAQTRQFVTLYEALQGFDDRTAQERITCPRLCFVGSADEIAYGERWGDVTVSIADPVVRGRADLEALGWQVHVLDGMNHLQAMQAATVLPLIRPWLAANSAR